MFQKKHTNAENIITRNKVENVKKLSINTKKKNVEESVLKNAVLFRKNVELAEKLLNTRKQWQNVLEKCRKNNIYKYYNIYNYG